MIRLKDDPQRELNLPGGGLGVQNPTEASVGVAARESSPRAQGWTKVGTVQNIKKLGPEVEVGRLAQGKPLVDRKIEGGQPGTFRGVASQVSIITLLLIFKTVGGLSPPGVGIPGIGAVIGTWLQVGPTAAEVLAGYISIPVNTEGNTAGQLNDAIDLPAFQQLARYSA